MKRRNPLNKFRSSVTANDQPQIAGGNHESYCDEFCELMNAVDPRVPCACGCEWVSPYG
jgi:hypothetical protein